MSVDVTEPTILSSGLEAFGVRPLEAIAGAGILEQRESGEYRSLTAQCLVMADITQPITNMLETLVLHIYSDYARSRDAEVGILISTGIIVRLVYGHETSGDPMEDTLIKQTEQVTKLSSAAGSPGGTLIDIFPIRTYSLPVL